MMRPINLCMPRNGAKSLLFVISMLSIYLICFTSCEKENVAPTTTTPPHSGEPGALCPDRDCRILGKTLRYTIVNTNTGETMEGFDTAHYVYEDGYLLTRDIVASSFTDSVIYKNEKPHVIYRYDRMNPTIGRRTYFYEYYPDGNLAAIRDSNSGFPVQVTEDSLFYLQSQVDEKKTYHTYTSYVRWTTGKRLQWKEVYAYHPDEDNVETVHSYRYDDYDGYDAPPTELYMGTEKMEYSYLKNPLKGSFFREDFPQSLSNNFVNFYEKEWIGGVYESYDLRQVNINRNEYCYPLWGGYFYECD